MNILVVLGLITVCNGMQSIVDTARDANQTTFVQALEQALDQNLLPDLTTGGELAYATFNKRTQVTLGWNNQEALLGTSIYCLHTGYVYIPVSVKCCQ